MVDVIPIMNETSRGQQDQGVGELFIYREFFRSPDPEQQRRLECPHDRYPVAFELHRYRQRQEYQYHAGGKIKDIPELTLLPENDYTGNEMDHGGEECEQPEKFVATFHGVD